MRDIKVECPFCTTEFRVVYDDGGMDDGGEGCHADKPNFCPFCSEDVLLASQYDLRERFNPHWDQRQLPLLKE